MHVRVYVYVGEYVDGWPLSIPLGENNRISRRVFANLHAPFQRGWLLTTPSTLEERDRWGGEGGEGEVIE